MRLHQLEGLNLVTPPAHTELMAKLEGASERFSINLTPYLSCVDQTPFLLQTSIALIGLCILPVINQKGSIPIGYKPAVLNENDVGTGYLNIVIEKKRHMTFAASKLHERLAALLDR